MYNTKQKNAVLTCLGDRQNRSLTVDGVCELLAARGEDISRSTVYRRLEELCREGKVTRFAPDAGKSVTYRFIGADCDADSHFHLICTVCGEVYHTHCDALEALFKHLADEHGFTVDNRRTLLYGLCAKCRAEAAE